jgi:DNA-binding MarR family transcriptional regulator
MMFVLGNKLQVIGDNFYEEITTKQWFVLLMLAIFGENAPTLNELSDALSSSHQNTKQLVLKLEKKGFLELYTDAKDRRKMRIRVTKACEELFKKYNTKQQDFMIKLFQGIKKEEIKTTLQTLTRFEQNLEDMKYE